MIDRKFHVGDRVLVDWPMGCRGTVKLVHLPYHTSHPAYWSYSVELDGFDPRYIKSYWNYQLEKIEEEV